MRNSKIKIILYLSIVCVLFLNPTYVKSQSVEIGIRYMPTLSSFDMKNALGTKVNSDIVLGHGVGALIGVNITKNIGIQGEVIYSSIAQKYKILSFEQKVNIQYVNIPVMLALNTDKTKRVNLNVVVGPQIGITVKSRILSSGTNNNSDQAVLSIKKGDLGFAYGAGIDVGLNTAHSILLGIGFRGVYGLFDISNNNKTLTTNSYYIIDRTHIKTYAAYIGISFLLGKIKD